MVLLCYHDTRGICVCVRLPHDGAVPVHQLQTEERGAHASQGHDVQVRQYLHRRFVRFHNQDAHLAQAGDFPRRHHLFIYLYQRWAYRIDYNRVNEFGQGGEDEAEEATEAQGKVLAAEKIKEVEAKVAATVEAKTTGADSGSAKKRK